MFEAVAKKYSKEALASLLEGEKGFREIMRLLASETPPSISTRTLSERLKDMETAGLVKRRILQKRPPTSIYSITEKGRRVLRLIGEIERA